MTEERVDFENARGQRLSAAVHRPGSWQGGGPSAVICHGMLSSKDSPKHTEIARRLAGRGLLALRFDFAGRGTSDGSLEDLTITGQVQDLEAAVSLAGSLGAGRVSLVGSSLGGCVAVLHAGGSGGIASLAVMASVSRPAEIFHDLLTPDELGRWKREGTHAFEEGNLGYGFYEDALTHDVPGAARRIGCPALFVHGSVDEVVPVSSSEDLHGAAAGPKKLVIVEEADHRFSDPAHLEQALGPVIDWIAP